jgi:flagellar protein FlaF
MDAYRRTQHTLATNLSSREMERNILIRITRAMEDAHQKGDKAALHRAVIENQTLWTVFVSDLLDERNSLPADLKKSIIQVGMTVLSEIQRNFRREIDVDFLLDINRQIIEGLQDR